MSNYRTISLFIFISVIFSLVGFYFSPRLGLLMLAASFLFEGFLYVFSGNIILKLLGAEPVEDKKIIEMVRKIAIEAGIPAPKVYITKHDTPNAFSAKGISNYIAITQGMQAMNKDEVKALISHEMAHIRFSDAPLASAVVFISLISFPAQLAYYTGKKYIFWPFFIIFLPLVLISSFFIKISVSNFVNYNADYRGALMTKHPRNLTAAIKKINEVAQHNQDEIWFISSASLWTVNPFKKHWFVDLLTSEPPIERRIRRLEEISGL